MDGPRRSEGGAGRVAVGVGDVAALAEGREPVGGATWSVSSPYAYEHSVRTYLGGNGGMSAS